MKPKTKQVIEYLKDLRNKLIVRIKYGKHPQPIEVEGAAEHHCMNCGTTFHGKFCPCCGQRGDTGRLTIKGGVENMLGVMASTDKGLLHTLLELVIRPGYMMRDYVRGHRVEYVRPIQLIFLLATVYLTVHYALYQHGEEVMNLITDKEGNALQMEGWKGVCIEFIRNILSNKAVRELFLPAFFCIPMWWAYRPTEKDYKTSLVEFFYVMVYVSCLSMLFTIIGLPIDFLNGTEDRSMFSFSFIFMLWAFSQYFGLKIKRCVLRFLLGLFYSLLPLTILVVIVVLIGILIQ